MVLPLSGIIFNQNQEKINTFLTEIPQGISSSLAQIPSFSFSTETITTPNEISTTTTLKNLNQVSQLAL
ncbi:MAG TPA: hypothetical protein V6D21_09895, partial [Candidatus Obscuribacterales bacterium]